jgi:uncharacterized membrane protein
MSDHLWTLLIMLACVGTGLNGGVFFIFSNTCMRAFDALPAAGAVAAMNSINRVILNPGFFLAFFGTALVCLVLLVGQIDRPLIVAASSAYLAGCIGVTMVCNVPLNEKLQKVTPSAPEADTQWRAYCKPWTRWNHVRAAVCLLAAALFAVSLVGGCR